MALIEGFRVQNYRALRDVMQGKLSSKQGGAPLTLGKFRDGLSRMVS